VILREAAVAGAYVVELEPSEDERGFFARTFSAAEFADRGLTTAVAECSISFNHARFTLRGLHYQRKPHEEAKLVRCARGAIFDVVADVRPDSPTYLAWDAAELSAENRRALYVPEGCAHGFLTLAEGAEVQYQISERYVPDAAAGVRWDDPLLGIEWPAEPAVVSTRDASFADLVSAW
jgi:dTDP-4-dehydrorhamnose 3,5-epimerase